jgi:hypothetical protein
MTGSPDGFNYCGHAWIDPGLNNVCELILNFFKGSSDFQLT